MDDHADENDLRRCVRDLVALSALSAFWTRTDLPGIAEGLAEVLQRSVPAEFIYVAVKRTPDQGRCEAVRTPQGPVSPGRAREVGKLLDPLLRSGSSGQPPTVANPFEAGTVRLAVIPIGYEGDGGFVVAGSPQPSFPSQTERLLLSVGANQAAVVVQHRQAEQALREADRRKDEFLATLAHELRNPLAPVRNALQVLRLAGDNPAVAGQARALMERQLGQMVRLIDDLLDVSRITRGKLELRPEPVELAAVVQSAVETSRPLIEAAGHTLTVTSPPQPVRLHADPTRLAQVFSNLLNNAAKYSERGGHIWLTASVRGQEAGVRGQQGQDQRGITSLTPDPCPLTPEVVVTVRDAGIGIPADMLSHIFEMFVQVDRSLEKAQGGLGIGLTLVKRLVEMHGGGVEAHSEGVGKGSEFRVRLPVAAESAAQAPPPADTGEVTSPKCRILVADDNVDAADSLGMLLTLMGHEVRTVHDGLAAVEAEAALQPDVILLDIGMPKLNGYDVARAIRERRRGEGVVLIALTGWGQEEDRRRSDQAGFDYHLVKPVDPSALEELLGRSNRTAPGGEEPGRTRRSPDPAST